MNPVSTRKRWETGSIRYGKVALDDGRTKGRGVSERRAGEGIRGKVFRRGWKKCRNEIAWKCHGADVAAMIVTAEMATVAVVPSLGSEILNTGGGVIGLDGEHRMRIVAIVSVEHMDVRYHPGGHPQDHQDQQGR